MAVKPAEIAPAATATEPGTNSVVELLDSVTVAGAGAGRFRVAMQLVPALDTSEAEVHISDDTARAGAVRPIEADCVEAPSVAAMVAVWSAAMLPAVAVKPAEVAPAATATELGTDSVVELLNSATVVSAGATPVRFTVHAVLALDTSEEAPHASDDTARPGANSPIAAVCVEAPSAAVIVAV